MLVLSAGASASFIEDQTTQVHEDLYYQEDGNKNNHGGDAPDTCEDADPAWSLGVGHDRNVSGMLVQEDDESDAYVTPINDTHVGKRLSLEILDSIGLTAYELGFDIRTPDCSESVFDPNATLYDTSQPAKEDPVEADDGEAEHEFRDLGDYDCNPDEWKFMIQQSQDIQPDSLYVEYTDRSWEYVPLWHGSPANVAMYLTSTNLEDNVTRVMFAISDAWDGKFKVAHGPCDVNGEIERPMKEPSLLSGEFTVVEPGDYVFLVFIEKDAVETTEEEISQYVPPPSSVPVRCDDEFCTLAFDGIEYDSELFPEEEAD